MKKKIQKGAASMMKDLLKAANSRVFVPDRSQNEGALLLNEICDAFSESNKGDFMTVEFEE